MCDGFRCGIFIYFQLDAYIVLAIEVFNFVKTLPNPNPTKTQWWTFNPISEYLLIPAVWVGGVESTPPAKNPLKSFWSHFFQVYI